MYILSIRTDKPEAELGLYEDRKKLDYYSWDANRQLAQTIHEMIVALIENNKLSLNDLGAITVFGGPGSFTGLRIGITVANALSYSLKIPISSEMGDDWIDIGIDKLLKGENQKIVTPEYGALPHITTPRK
jgi:tRNA threonylcarbamoyladenosine biosynthesis protein TsaB